MKDELDLVKLFEGLSAEQARELSDRLRAAIENEVQTFEREEQMNISAETIAELQRLASAQGGQEQHISNDEAEETSTALYEEYKRLMREPVKNARRLGEIEGEIDELQGRVDRREAARAQAWQAKHAQELQKISGDMQTIEERMSAAMKNPTQHAAEIERLQGEMAKREQRLGEIERGPQPGLNWDGGG